MVIIRNADLNFYDYIIEIWQFLPNVLNFKKEEGPFAFMLSLMVHHSKSACLVKILYCHGMFMAKVTVTANTVEPFVNKLGMVMWMSTVFIVKVISLNYNGFYYIFWTTDPFASTLSFIVHHSFIVCLVKVLDCCVQGQGHSESSKLH